METGFSPVAEQPASLSESGCKNMYILVIRPSERMLKSKFHGIRTRTIS